MKRDWIEKIRLTIADKAEISTNKIKTLEATVTIACRKMALPTLKKNAAEDMISYAGKVIKHFGLGREYDAKIPDKAHRNRRRIAWKKYQDRKMGLRQ